ncbi:MAG: HPr family phosphocarrier protein [Desulfococcaceae bacterium]|jgi:phosphotransferase system HPr-like phosphotransfer protein|nr:HPr family phosphocarrier protein [Desulfococcaceae bacterium]
MENRKCEYGNTFKDKICLFSYDYLKCCLFLAGPDAPEEGRDFTKKLFSKLIGTSQVLESFLDFHGAKNNKDWYLYRELTAAVRHVSLGGYSQKHILNRLVFYNLKDTGKFESEGCKNLDLITKSLKRTALVILDEARRLKIPIPPEGFESEDFPAITTGERLEYNINDEEKYQQKQHVVKIANDFLKVAEHFDQHEFFGTYSAAKIKELVPESINEVEVRRYEMLVHNLQSSFDTYVIHGGYEFGQRKLKDLRSHFSVVFHILQMMGRFLHFYERHLHEAGYKDIYKKVRNQLSFLVDPDTLLDRTINYGLYYTCHFLSRGKELAWEILKQNIETGVIKVGLPEPRGFHNRPSMMVAKVVQHYGCPVELCVGDSRFDAGSILDIMWAGGKIQNENIKKISFKGDIRALHDLKILAGVNYGEDSMGKEVPLPYPLKYLRE